MHTSFNFIYFSLSYHPRYYYNQCLFCRQSLSICPLHTKYSFITEVKKSLNIKKSLKWHIWPDLNIYVYCFSLWTPSLVPGVFCFLNIGVWIEHFQIFISFSCLELFAFFGGNYWILLCGGEILAKNILLSSWVHWVLLDR